MCAQWCTTPEIRFLDGLTRSAGRGMTIVRHDAVYQATLASNVMTWPSISSVLPVGQEVVV